MAEQHKSDDHAQPRFSPRSFAATPSTATFDYSEASPQPPLTETTFALAAEALSEKPAPVAILVCHGMGEQVRFETVGQIASSVLSAAKSAGCTNLRNNVHLCQEGTGLLARAELSWTTRTGVEQQAHIYEAYWAPVTEGKVTYRDTLLFLFQAAWRGFWNSSFLPRRTFQRWIFGDLRNMTISAWTKLALVLVAVVLAAEVGVIAFVSLKIATGIKELSTAAWPMAPSLHSWSVCSAWLLAKSFFVFLGQCLLQLLKPFIPEHAALHRLHNDRAWWGAALRTIGWLAMIAQAFFVRYFLIEYAGDVAAYISPYKDSKFDAVRTEIQQIGLNVGRIIYGFDVVPGVPDYERVIVAGHSLGSVLAYDTLNALINADLTSGRHRGVVRRTTHLITFGSPLDKTAFLFRTQSNHVKDPLREQMAAGFQPLVLSYKDFRKPLQWINLWSPMDIISGNLDYYDYRGNPPDHDYAPVDNRIDPGAWVPFYAHVQYWNGRKLAETLFKAI